LVWNVPPGIHQKTARQADNPLIGAATGRGRQFSSLVRHVHADHGKITVCEFPDVRAADSLLTVSVRSSPDSAKKHGLRIHAATTIREARGKCKDKMPAIAGLVAGQAWATLLIVATYPANRKSLGQAIRSYRKKSKLTQERLGELADLNPKYIGEVERMEKTISVDALARIAAALKVRLRDLVRDA
jgi:DNA-binding XRE family transcriptional regulator